MTVNRVPPLAPPLTGSLRPAATRRAAPPPAAAPAAATPRAAGEPELAGALTEEERAHFLAPGIAGSATYASARPGTEDLSAMLGRHLDVKA